MREISILKERILQYLDNKGITKYEFYKNTGISNGILSQKNGLSEENQLRFLSYYTDINPTWLLTGRGEMLVGGKKYADLSENTHLNMASDHKPAYNSDLVAYLERKLDEKTRECYDLQAKIEGLACELRRRREAPAEEHPLASVG